MEMAAVAERLERVVVDTLDPVAAAGVLGDLRLLITAAERMTAAVHARLVALSAHDPAVDPERINARATHRSEQAARRDRARATTLSAAPTLADVVDAGGCSMEHADVLDAAAHRLDVSLRDSLYHHPHLAKLAERSTPSQFRSGVAQLVREVQTDDGIDTFEHQHASARFDCRLDHRSGMYRLDGWLDPERGAELSAKLHTRVEALFHDTTPAGCPTDALERQAHLRALALIDLINGNNPQSGVVEMSIVVDIETLRRGCHEQSLIEFGPDGAIVPIETLRRRLCLSDRAVIVMRDGVGLALGRERRVATRDQRTMARAMYPTCAIAGCEVAFERCELHHIIWWRHGGTTDLANLVPLCSKHHHCAHEGHWQLALDPDTRVLTVTYPDGTTEHIPPPRARPPDEARDLHGLD